MLKGKIIKAPSKILVGLRFKHKCKCGRVISSNRMVCRECSKKPRL